MENKKFKAFAVFGKFTWVGKALLLVGVFAVAGLLYLFIAGGGALGGGFSGGGGMAGGFSEGLASSSDNNSGSAVAAAGTGTGAGGMLANILKNGSAIALKSWNQVFGGSDQSSQQQDVSDSDEVDLAAESSTMASSSGDSAVSAGLISQTDGDSASDEDAGDVTDGDAGAGAGDTSQASAPAAKATKTAKAVPQFCSFGNASTGVSVAAAGLNAGDGIILNEIAWMGSLAQDGETGAKASEREWIELKNISAAPVDVSGWQVLDAAGNLKIILGGGANAGVSTAAGSGDTIVPAGGFYLLVRDDGSLPGVQADAGYSGSLPNTGDQLAVFDANCGVSDFLDASGGWPAGNNTTKQTMERDANVGVRSAIAGGADGIVSAGWHTSVAPGGTPRAENSVPMSVPAAATASTSVSTAVTTPTATSPTNIIAPVVVAATSSVPAIAPQYLISVSAIGDGDGTVETVPPGILCGFTCEASYAAGTKINFTQTPAAGSLFKEWSGACKGAAATATTCSFTVSGSVSVVAEFDAAPLASLMIISTTSTTASSSDSDNQLLSSNTTSPSSTSSTSAPNHLLIAAIQIAGASSSNDFVKIFNPTMAVADISGWKLHKKSSTGTDASLRTLPAGSLIAPGGYFVWANSVNGFSETIAADVSSTETLSVDNSVALFDAAGNIIDQVAWGTGTNQYVEGSAYPTDPTANQVLARKVSPGGDGSGGSAMVDTDDNAADFGIQ